MTALGVKKPYVGPNPFEEADRDIFFGRDQETRDVCSLVIAHGEVLLFARSGAGKSSLLNAGVIPLLTQKGLHVRPPTRVSGIVPRGLQKQIDNIFVFNALRRLAQPDCGLEGLARQTLETYLRHSKSPEGIAPAPSSPEVLIFDQLEEIFEIFPGCNDEQEGFFRQVGEALEADSNLRVVFSMREDYIARLTPFVSLLPERMKTRSHLERLRSPNALEAITGPLRKVQPARVFLPGVAEKLVKNLSLIRGKGPSGEIEEQEGEFVEPVQLAVVCDSLWESLSSDVVEIAEEHVEKFGDVTEALARFYEYSLSKTVASTAVKEADLRRWFGETLITREGTRGTVYRGQDDTAGIPNNAVDLLQDLHLIRQEQRAGGAWYELCHDRFIAPIQESNEAWRRKHGAAWDLKQRLEQQAAECEAAGWPADKLLDATQLAEAEAWLLSPAAADLGYSPGAMALINRSKIAQQKHEMDQQQRQIELIEAKAQAEQERAEAEKERAEAEIELARLADAGRTQALALAAQQAKAARRLLLFFVATALAAGLLVTLLVVFRRQTRNRMKANFEISKRQRELDRLQNARQAQKISDMQAAGIKEKEFERQLAVQRDKARREKVVESSWRLTAVASDNLPERAQIPSAYPVLSLLLSLKALRESVTVEAVDLLSQSFEYARERMVLPGNFSRVTDVAFSSDGKLLATAGDGGIVRIWNPSSGNPVLVLDGDMGPIMAVAFGPKGRRVAAAGKAGTARVWSVAPGQQFGNQLLPIVSNGSSLLAIAFSSDGLLLATGGSDHSARVWNAQSGKLLRTIKGHSENVESVAFSRDGELATASADKTVRIWDPKTGKELITPLHHDGTVWSVAFSRDGKYIATGSADHTAKIWDLDHRKVITIKGHQSDILEAKFSYDGRSVVTASRDGTARLWRTRDARLLETFAGHTGPVLGVDISPDGSQVATASGDGTAMIWNSRLTGRPLRARNAPSRGLDGPAVTKVAFSPDANKLVTVAQDGTLSAWDGASREELFSKSGKQGGIVAAAFSPHGHRLATAGKDGTTAVRDSSTGHRSVTIAGFHGPASVVAFSPKGELLASGRDDGIVILADARSGKILKTLPLGARPVEKPRASHDSTPFAGVNTASAKAGAKKAPQPQQTGSRITAMAFSPHGRLLATADGDHTAKLWDTRSGRSTTLSGHTGSVDAVAFNASGKLVATGSADGTVRIWSVSSGQELFPPISYEGAVNALAFEPQGNRLAIGGAGANVWIWDAARNTRLFTLPGHSDKVEGLIFIPGGQGLVALSADGTEIVHPFAPEELERLAQTRISRPFTPEECKTYHLSTLTPKSCKAGAFLAEAGKLATTGSLSAAMADFREAERLDPHLPFEPAGRAKYLRANALLHEGMVAASHADLENSDATLRKVSLDLANAVNLDPAFHFQPDEEAGRLVAEALDKKGQELAKADHIRRSVLAFQKVRKLDPSRSFDPQQRAEELDLTSLVEHGRVLAWEGQIDEAVATYEKAKGIDAKLPVPGTAWNTLCWWGSLYSYPEKVVNGACEQAVASDPHNTDFQDSRGLARALTGDTRGAIQDFEAFIRSPASNDGQKKQRTRWVEALRAGNNPFTKEERKALLRTNILGLLQQLEE